MSELIDTLPNALATHLCLTAELNAVVTMLDAWVERCDDEFKEVLRFAFAPGSKHLRALTLLSCDAAMRTTAKPGGTGP